MSKLLQQKKESLPKDTKPTILARILYRGILRYIKATRAQNRENNYSKTLDFAGERRVNMRSNDID